MEMKLRRDECASPAQASVTALISAANLPVSHNTATQTWVQPRQRLSNGKNKKWSHISNVVVLKTDPLIPIYFFI